MAMNPSEQAPVIIGEPNARQRAVSEAITSWKRQLIDLGGRNNLLYFRDLRVGTLDISTAARGTIAERLISGKPIRLSQLFPGIEDLKDAARRGRTLRAKAIENDEERGLQTLHVAWGLATWNSDRSSATPNAPVVLYRLTLSPLGVASEDFILEVSSEPEVNPTLLHLLETDFGIRFDGDDLDILNGSDSDPPMPNAVIEAVLQGSSVLI